MQERRCYGCMKIAEKGQKCKHCGSDERIINESHQLAAGTMLQGKYLIGRVLGQGGFGITYIGLDVHLDTVVAVKEYYPASAVSRNTGISSVVDSIGGTAKNIFEKNKERFVQEARTMVKLSGIEEIVQVRNFFQENNTAYIVMEYVEGVNLKQYVREQDGRLSGEEIFRIFLPLIRALEKVHKSGIVHRDISPENIMMLSDGRAKLIDFGAVRNVGDVTVGYMPTKSTEAILKQGYAPPEQYQSRGKIGPWTDVYSLCATICYCLTGEIPLDAPERMLGGQQIQLCGSGIDIPREMENVILHGMELKISERILSMEELYTQLASIAGSVPGTRENTEKGRGRNVFFFAGIAIACAAMAVSWTVKHPGAGKQGEIQDHKIAAENSGAGSDVFKEAYVFSGDDSDEFQKLMEDESITAVIVDSDDLCTFEVTVTKPVRVETDANWAVQNMTVARSGYVEVAGGFNLAGLLRIQGSDGFFVAEDAEFTAEECSYIWMEHEDSFRMENAEETDVPGIVFSEEIFESDDVVSVTNYEELSGAARQGKLISIDADMDLTGNVAFTAPVRIAEGVKVNTVSADGRCHQFVISQNAVLVNNGMFSGGLQGLAGAAAVNFGSVQAGVPDGRDGVSLWFEEDCAFLNFGEMDAEDTSRMWTDSLFFNFGTLNADDFYLAGGDMANFGNIKLPQSGGVLRINDGSMLWNKAGGAVNVEADAKMLNDGWIYNQGEILVENAGIFDSTALENTGLFQVENGAVVGKERNGIYCGSGEFDLGMAEIEVYRTETLDHMEKRENLTKENLAGVGSPEELARAMEDPDVEVVCVTQPVTMNTDLTVTKPLWIDRFASLTFTDGAGLSDYGEEIVLLGESSLQAGSISLYEKAKICMDGDSKLVLEEGGTLMLDHSILMGHVLELREVENNIQLDGADVILRNHAACIFPYAVSADLDGSRITLQDDAVFIPSCRSEADLSGATITVHDGASFSCVSDTELEDCSLNIDHDGILRNAAQYLVFRDCDVKVGEGGTLEGDCVNLSLLGGTVLENRGSIDVRGWGEYVFAIHGSMTNYGDINADIRCDVSGQIDNQGNFYYSSAHNGGIPDWDVSCVAGNAPIKKND